MPASIFYSHHFLFAHATQELESSLNISNKKTVFEVAGGPVKRMCTCSLEIIQRIINFLISENPTIELNNLSS